MKFVFSNWSNTLGHKTSSIKLAKISNFLIQDQGFQTVLFADKSSIDYFKDIPYNEIHEIKSHEMENIPKCLWSMSKLVAISKINEPFLHIDFDLFLFKLNKPCLEKDIICLHTEFYMEKAMERLQKIMKIQAEQTLGFRYISYNCGIVGGRNFEFFKKASKEILEYISENKSHIDEIYSKNLDNKSITIQIIPVLVEQVWMFQLFKFYNQKFDTYLESGSVSTYEASMEMYEKGLIHFQHAKTFKNCDYLLDEFIKQFNI
jgi:hypothetical protein